MNLHHFAVVCSSIENADKFYENILELEKIKNFIIDKDLTEKIFNIPCECRLLLYSNKNFAVEVFIMPDFNEKKPSFEHFCLEVEDKKKFVQKCKSAECDVNIIPKGDFSLTFIKDFDGNMFEIKEIETLS
ncbi:MAG: VOC family protein [Deltaproteobacteria bacterium]|nr:VOC family protein [Deltaproteobacteria bacterium]MBW2218622.1 VOC family protein [Deltaproteobacteria bacterium]